MRKLTDHRVNGLNEAITINVLDELGQGGACHEYEIRLYSPAGSGLPRAATGDMEVFPDGSSESSVCRISFQNGPVKEAGFNGISQEALMAIVIDRLRSFQAGPFKCYENVHALTHFEEGLMWLQKRTMDRMKRGVEGTNQT